MLQTAFFSSGPSHTCARCGRDLSNHVSVQSGKGPVCRGKQKASLEVKEGFTDITTFEPIQNGIIVQRLPSGEVSTNIPHHCVHHSPTGFEFGYAGSGPADLALNIVESILYSIHFDGEREKVWRGECFQAAYEIHQAFKFAFIAPIPRETGAVIPYADALAFVQERLAERTLIDIVQ